MEIQLCREQFWLPDVEPKVKQIVAGSFHTVALKEDGTLWAWGYNRSGQLGVGIKTGSSEPVQVKGIEGIKAVAAGVDHIVVVKEDGSVWTCGDNKHGQLGDGRVVSSNEPVQVKIGWQ